MHFPWRRTRIGMFGLLVLASCLGGRPSAVTLAPSGADAPTQRTQGPFAVVHAAPRGRVLDRKQPGVTVLFSRGVRSVDMADDEKLPAVSIKTKSGAPVPGSFRWTGTRGLLFTPDGEIPGGNDFIVNVPGDIKALDGSPLSGPYTLEFETDGPKVESVRVPGPPGVSASSMASDSSIRIQFDQSVDPAAVAAATTLRVFRTDGEAGQVIKVTGSREPAAPATPATPAASTAASATPPKGKPAAAKTPAPAPILVPPSYVVVLKPEKPLPLDHQVELTVANLRGTGGPRPMAEPYVQSLRTHGALRFVDYNCPRIAARGRCRANGDVKVVMSTPVSPEEFKAHVRVGKLPSRPPPKPGAKNAPPPRLVGPAMEHWLGVAPKLGEKYTVTVTAGMRDIYGQRLDKDASFEVVVESPLVKPAGVTDVAPVASAPPPEVRKGRPVPPPRPGPVADMRPRRERLPYNLDLGLVGRVLEANVGHKVPVGSVNIPNYGVVSSALTDAQAASFVLAKGNSNDFLTRNGLVPTWKTVRADENLRNVEFIDLDAALNSRKGRGPALIVLSPAGAYSDSSAGRTEAMVTVTDLGVTAKVSPFGSLVWVTQLSSGKPVAGASVALRTAKGGEIWQGTTGPDGVVLVPADKFDPLSKEAQGRSNSGDDEDEHTENQYSVRQDAALVVRSGDDWTITKIEPSTVESRLTSDFQLLSKEGRWAGMLFADRGVFRPGETAKVSGIVRVVEAGGLRTIAGRELRIQLKDKNSEQIFDGRAKCDEFGTFALDVKIPKSAEIGTATLVATAPPGGKTNTSQAGDFRHEIRILAYKPNEFKVTAQADKPFYVRGDTAVFTTQGDYLFGAPMPGAQVTSTVSRQEVPFTPPQVDGFTVSDDVFTGDYPDDTKAAEQVDSQDGTLDAKGQFARSVDLSFDDQRRPERVVFDAEVQDISRNTVSARNSVLLHPAEFYVGIRTPKDRFVAAGAPLKVEVAAVDPTGARRASVKVKVELVARRWNALTGEQPDGKPMRSSKAEDSVVSSCDALTSAQASGCELKVPSAGYFILRATAQDPRGNAVRASTSVYGTEEAPQTPMAWASDDRHEIKIETNKKSYDLGETAKIVLRNPFKEATAMVTVERNGVLHRQVMPIKGPVPVIEVPIKPEFYPNAFVSVVALRGRVQAPPASGADLGAPEYRFGWAELHVNEEAHRLKVSVTQPKAEYQPGNMVEADVKVVDRAGKPVESAVTFYVVDEGVLALTSYVTPDPLPAFVRRRKLRVFTFDNREGLARILPMKAGERLSPLGYEFALARNAGDGYDKGDDGGDGGIKRADFRTTAYFEGGRKTDKNGAAHFSFKLPDNLTTFRIMAVAAGAEDHFGSGESKITTFRTLMARPALPRLLRVGDELEASVIVSSKGGDKGQPGAPMAVDVKVDVKGLTLVGANTKRVTMPRGGQTEVRFPVKAVGPGEASVKFDVRSGADVDIVELKRNVELPVHVASKVVYGETSSDASVALGDLSAMRPDFGGLQVRLSSSALVGLGMTVDKLSAYPYGCTEQITSKLIPMLAAFELSQDGNAHLPSDVNSAIDAGVEGLLKRQNGDGGFGFWDKSSSEPWLSAYAMLALAGAAEKKRFVPRDVLDQGRSYLNFSLANATRKLAKTETEQEQAPTKDAGAAAVEKKHKEEIAQVMDYASAALAADTLAILGASNPGALNVLYDNRSGQRLFGQAALLHAMVKSDMPEAQRKTLAKEIEGRLRVGANGVDVDEPESFEFSPMLESRSRTLAMVLRALLAADAKHPLAARMARQLLSARQQDGAWRTTQEDGWALLALSDYRKLQEAQMPGFEVSTSLGGDTLLSSKFTQGSFREDRLNVAASTLARGGSTLSFDVSGGGKLYYAAELKYATAALPKRARDEGLFVSKYLLGVPTSEVADMISRGIPKRSATLVDAGDVVIVDLVFETAEPRERVVLDDPLPAGLEALDYDIDTTSQARREAERRSTETKTSWLGTTFRNANARREVRDDRVVHYMDKLEPGMYRVRYLARAASIGNFVTPPTRIEAMYSPEVYGTTAATQLVVKARQ